MKKEKSFKIKKNIKAEGTEKLEYEIRTMEKDVEELKKKLGIIDSEKLPEPPAPPKPTLKAPKLPEPPKPVPPKLSPIAKRSGRKRKILIPFIIAAIILLIAGGVYYWWNYLRVPGEEPKPLIEKLEPKVPVSFVEVDETLIIEIDEDETLFGKLKEKAEQEREQNTFQRILIKKVSPEKDYFLPFQEIAEILYITIPLSILNSLTEEHTLFFYSQEEGNRLGVIVKVEGDEILKTSLEDWEKTMTGDLKPIFLGQKLGESANEEFQDNIYRDVNIRYLNFPDPSLTIDYTVVENYLIITTSREGMYGVIDRILEENPTAIWKTYRNEEHGFEVKYPDYFGEVAFEVQGGDTGKSFEGSFTENAHLTFSGRSEDFSFGRGAYFADFIRYKEEGAKYFHVFHMVIEEKNEEIEPTIITSDSGVTILKVDENSYVEERDVEGPAINPGRGALGALINLSKGEFPGIAFWLRDKNEISEDIFNQILSTFKFLD